jgi:hypothetical protein
LPIEVVRVIIDNLLRKPRDLNALAQTCHWLYDIVNPILYKEQIIHYGGTALLWAAQLGSLDACARLLKEGLNPDVVAPRSKETPLIKAIEKGHLWTWR